MFGSGEELAPAERFDRGDEGRDEVNEKGAFENLFKPAD